MTGGENVTNYGKYIFGVVSMTGIAIFFVSVVLVADNSIIPRLNPIKRKINRQFKPMWTQRVC